MANWITLECVECNVEYSGPAVAARSYMMGHIRNEHGCGGCTTEQAKKIYARLIKTQGA